ncbi:TetR/AcrR family transcriptional regulator [Nocardioides sp. cx-169]|uniref:TetR/AcrR family transcriptional regulator n=1 Tax=Nocardioides sp. cx-169 TaxID=2899080 RepID=UPI001E412912|nr:TetR/AcrR family transcriptional regulator [Nocardioides sp. cx-169]MCD4533646.1 TetR/AcrR family transcriptional regulator [Nocardioides sp. cx-169]
MGTTGALPVKKERVKSRKYYDRRERVIDVAVELFSRNGYASTGVADIGDAAGLARGALYYYIGSKDALLAEIHDRVMDPLLREAEAVAALDVDLRTRLRLLSESLLWQVIHKKDHVWVFLHEYHQLEGERRAQFREKRQEFEGCVQGVIAQGAAHGLWTVSDPQLATFAFLNLHNYTYQWVGGRRDLEVEGLAGFYCHVFLDGIASPAEADEVSPGLLAGRALLDELRRPD